MKISEMSFDDLRMYMKTSREIHRFDASSAAWKAAFSYARKMGYENLEMDCGKCVAKVTELMTIK